MLRRLDAGFRRRPAASVGPVSFQVHRGECLGIVGVSGSGMNFGRIFQRDGTLVATAAQEGLMRLGRR